MMETGNEPADSIEPRPKSERCWSLGEASGSGGGPGSSGPASLGCVTNASDGSPGLEYDLWEGQFEFVGPSEHHTRLIRPVQQQVSTECNKVIGLILNKFNNTRKCEGL